MMTDIMTFKRIKGSPPITRIDLEEERSQAALAAEQRLFAHYNLNYKVHFVELEEPNLRVRVLEVGEGPPLMLVPGGSGDAGLGAGLMAALKGWRFIAINRPGGGLSDSIDNRQIDQRRLATDTLNTVADAFGLQGVPVLGGSMGGSWAFWYALDKPKRVSKMIQLGCPGLILNTSTPFFMRLLGVPGINRLIVKNLQPNSPEQALDGLRFQGSSKEDIKRMPNVLGEAAYHYFQLPTYLDTWTTLISAITTLSGANPKYQLGADELQNVQQPVLFLWGENDPFGDLDVAHQVAQAVPGAELQVMKTGHLPLFDQPDECGRLIGEFLSRGTQ